MLSNCSAKVRALNRVVIVGEILRANLKSLAIVVPHWFSSCVPSEWHTRYDHRVDESRLPKDKAERIALVETIGNDGWVLLAVIDIIPELQWLHQVPAVQTLRKVWIQQFEMVEGRLSFRSHENIPPPAQMICSPYDVEATYGRKRAMWWTGYKVHVTETCDEEGPHLITHVETSKAGNGDVDVTPVIHRALKEKQLLPQKHLTDSNYAEAKQFLDSLREYGIDLIVPTRSDNKWQAKEQQGFDAANFQID